jgi:hypothetical protein
MLSISSLARTPIQSPLQTQQALAAFALKNNPTLSPVRLKAHFGKTTAESAVKAQEPVKHTSTTNKSAFQQFLDKFNVPQFTMEQTPKVSQGFDGALNWLHNSNSLVNTFINQAAVTLGSGLNLILPFIPIPNQNVANLLKRSPFEVAYRVAPYNPLDQNKIKMALSAVNNGSLPLWNGAESQRPASLLRLLGSSESTKQTTIRALADLAFKESQVNTVDFSKLETAEAMIEAFKGSASGEGARLVVLDKLFAGKTADDKEKLKFANYLESTLFSSRAEAMLKKEGINFNGAMLILNLPHLVNAENEEAMKKAPKHSEPVSSKVMEAVYKIDQQRFYAAPVPYNVDIDCPENKMT